MKRIFFLFFLAAQVGRLIAGTIDIETAKLVAKNFMLTRSNNISLSIKSIELESTNGEPIYYVINFQAGGWVLVSAKNTLMPILGYNNEGEYILDAKRPEALIELIDSYKNGIKKTALKSVNVEVLRSWNLLKTASKLKSWSACTPSTTLLNIPSRGGEVNWGQGANNNGGCNPSFNEDCPSSDDSDCDCDRKPVGCAAVAMGQIMWKWRWPQSYNWSEMKTVLKENDNRDIPKLLRDCGNAADMVYWCSGSWTTMNEVEDAFKAFNYKGVEKRTRVGWPFGIGGSWPSNVWRQMIRNEIDCGRPVLYRGDECDLCTSKHFFVVDGYDANDVNLFHINWGWRGSYNGYFNLDDLTPGSDNFNDNQMAIIGISPSLTAIPANITDVNYTVVTENKAENALNSISLPANGKNLTVNSIGNLILSATDDIQLNEGFSVDEGGSLSANINSYGYNDCGLQLMHIDNAIIKGRSDYTGVFEIRAVNANSYEFVVMNRNNNVVYLGVGKLENNVTTAIWDGTGADFEAVYLGALTLRNNCGERVYKNQDITVLLGKSKSTKIDTMQTKPIFYEENGDGQSKTELLNIANSNEFIIYPNPNGGEFSIGTATNNLPYSLSITNTTGQVIYKSNSINSESTQIKLPQNIRGYCIVEIISNKKKFYYKLIIEN